MPGERVREQLIQLRLGYEFLMDKVLESFAL
jgi:hypothetical protein